MTQNKFTAEEVIATSLPYFNGDELAANVFLKYALQDNDGFYRESHPNQMHSRMAKEFYRIENKYPNPISYEEIFDKLNTWEWVPQGSPMSAIGNPFQLQSLSNCFVIPDTLDSYGGIFLTDQQQVQIMKRRGGVGNDISGLRPKNMSTSNAAKTTDGIGVFMERFSNSTREVAQNGRRGARMTTISVHHPEIETFINIKKDRKKVTGSNISIRLTDEFMEAVESDNLYQQRFPVETGESMKQGVSAKLIFSKIAEAAWDCAEPGVLYWDTILRGSVADCYADAGFKTISTNPCGEITLSALDSCRLLLINLTKFVRNPFTDNAYFDLDEHYLSVFNAQRLMDDLIDLELEAIDKIINKIDSDSEPDFVKSVEKDLWLRIKEVCIKGRRTGLGVTGLGDVIAMMGMKYGSPESIRLTEAIYRNQAQSSYASSVRMAKERGAFPAFDLEKELNHSFIKQLGLANSSDYIKYGRRNIALLTTSPAGSVSCLTQTTSGCEPAIYLSYKRRKKVNPNDPNVKVDFIDQSGDSWQEYKVFHHGHKAWLDLNPNKKEEESPYYGSTAEEINPREKIFLQSAAQKWVDHSISNTINLPKTATVEDIADLYLLGWKTGCKGLTVYRDGSRSGVLVKESNELPLTGIIENNAPKRPKILDCELHRSRIKGQEYLVIIGLLDGKPYEMFAGLADNVDVGKKTTKGTLTKNGTSYTLTAGEEVFDDVVSMFDNPNYGAFTRTISMCLRHGVPVKYLVEQLRKDKYSDLFSFSTVISRILSKSYIKDGVKAGKSCPECGSHNIVYIQGCPTCQDCGYSKCG